MIISDISRMNDVAAVGGKAKGLAKLCAHGLNVPEFFVVTADTNLYSQNFAAELEVFAANLHCESFAVRSSSVNEDGFSDSFAGQYSTLLNVKQCELLNAVREVAKSCDNLAVKKYSERVGDKPQSVAVVVQRQLEGDYSGVMFTTSPYNSEERIIECVKGGGERLVGGQSVPNEQVKIKKSAQANGFYSTLCEYARLLEDKEGIPLDIEWTVCGGKVWLLQMRPLTAIGDELPPIPKRKWNIYVYRDFCPFAHSVQRKASEKSVQTDTFGFCVPIAEGLIVNGREFYSEESDEAANEVWKKLDSGEFFKNYIEGIKELTINTRKRADKLKNKDCEKLSVEELFTVYRREIDGYIKSYVPLMMRPDDYLYEKLVALSGEERAEEICAAAAVTDGQTYYSEERRQFLLAVKSGAVEAYLDNYEWMTNPLAAHVESVTAERFAKRASSITRAQAEEKLREIERVRERDAAMKKQTLDGLNEEELKLFKIISEFVYLRTYTAENSDRYCYYLRKRLIENIAKKLGIASDVICLMSFEEIAEAEHGFRLSVRDAAKRRSGEAIIIKDGESKAYYTGKSYALLKKLLPDESSESVAALTGKVACMGEVRARVKIVNDFAHADEFEEGCILVTTMTVPEITAALDKASGIITDEGGITCHAAIIAREYSLPCLVGTKNATSVLKDGMLVYLDCVNGRVIIEE